ncbi:isochorismate synthase [uncultured Bacteroides sp.]|uniref:isochorismate synthase n=1 Tax=uncultured Bacteroides sp. TaxID=162156 RepID=UPI002604F894|nr:isochorismate synthase [uncultured Bacteroides sp.]
MNIPVRKYQNLIDRLTGSDICFALYRIPWTDEPLLVLQEEGEAETLEQLADLNEKNGFLLAPFLQSPEHPIVLIRPDKTATDWDAICSALDELLEKRPDLGDTEESPSATDRQPKAGHIVMADDNKENRQLYNEAFARFIGPLKEKTFQKLVLSRKAVHTLEDDFSPLETFVKACNSYPRMMISLCHTPKTGTWLGSTPEIILSGNETLWNTVALAGTMPMQGEVMPTEWSKKNQEEQAIVSEYIRRIVKKFGSKITEKGPYTARAGQLVHLKTDFHFLMKDAAHQGSILQELHPTPAVCGLPKQEAYEFISENEGFDRRYYSGIIGWLDPQGETSLYVNLRCMNIEGRQATLYAGGGILPSSTPETEWEETQQKMNTMRTLL